MPRSPDDACPGSLRLHEAADGLLARVRIPGGILTPEQLGTLATAALEHAGPELELTSRGNVQLRSVRDRDAVTGLLSDAGLLPAASHERVRNIVASPLSGRTGPHPDIRPLVAELDGKLTAMPELSGLPGKFLFSIDDGRGDMSALAADIGLNHLDGAWTITFAGATTALRHQDPSEAVDTALTAAHVFLRIRESRWRVNDLDDGPATLAAAAGTAITAPPGPVTGARSPVGWIEQHDALVTLAAVVPLGRLAAGTAALIAAAEKPVVITPWRSLLLCDLTHDEADVVLRVLAPRRLVFDENSPWVDVSACTGLPGCARSATDVHADVRLHVAEELTSGIHPPVHQHWVGCERACGSPTFGQILVATDDGYRPLQRHP